MIELMNEKFLLKYDYRGSKEIVNYKDLAKFWDYSSEEEIETGRAYGNEKIIYGFFTVANGQGGVLFVFDKESKKFTHVSEGSYAIDCDVDDGYIYSLVCISNFRCKAKFVIYAEKIGVLDAFKEGTMYLDNIEIDTDDWNGELDSVKMIVEENKITINIGDNKIEKQKGE